MTPDDSNLTDTMWLSPSLTYLVVVCCHQSNNGQLTMNQLCYFHLLQVIRTDKFRIIYNAIQ